MSCEGDRELWTPMYFGGFEGPGWSGFQLDLGQDVVASADHARWIADEVEGDDEKGPAAPVDTSRQLPLPGLRADARTRSIVFRALRLIGDLLPTGVRGVGAARMLVAAPLPRAWDRRVTDLEGRPWRFMERLVKASDLGTIWTEKTVQAAFLRLHEVCPDLVVRVNREEYLIPFGELRDPTCARLTRLELWCREMELQLEEREIKARSHDISAERLRRFQSQLRPGRRGYTGASALPRSPQVNPDEAHAAAARELERLGPAVQGEAGDQKTFRAACIGEDFGLSVQEFRPLLEAWNLTCEPPWPPRQLERKLGSAQRNRKRPVGYRVQADLVSPAFDAASRVGTDSVCSMWEAALSLALPAARAGRVWAERRGLDALQLLERDLVRVLSPLQRLPPTHSIGGVPWTEAGYRLVLPIFDVAGELAGLRARHIDGPQAAVSATGEAPQAGAHELMAARTHASGLCFADETGRAMLRGAQQPREVWISQNGPDFLTLTDLLGRTDDRAVLGVFAGSWTAETAARLPAGARVVLATHASRTGDVHARRLAATLVGRCDVLRLVLPPGTTSVNEAHCGPAHFDLTALEPFELGVTREPRPTPPHVAQKASSAWERRALDLLQSWPHAWQGPPRELARALLLCVGERVTPSAVRGLERALIRLREQGRLPQDVTLVAAWSSTKDEILESSQMDPRTGPMTMTRDTNCGCGRADCDWNTGTCPREPAGPLVRGTDEGGVRDFLVDKPVHCGDGLEHLVGDVDRGRGRWERVRYECTHKYNPAGGQALRVASFVTDDGTEHAVTENDRFRWPVSARKRT